GNVFTYIDNNGNSQTINFSTIVKANETVTTLSQDLTSGTISYINEKGIDQKANIKSLENGNLLKNGINGGLFFDKKTIIDNQALASLVYTNNYKELQFNNGNGIGYTIGIEPLIYNNASIIFSAGPVKNEISKLIDLKKDLVTFSNYSFKKNDGTGISKTLTDDRKVLEINVGNGVRKEDLGTYIWSKDKDIKTIIIKGEGYLNLDLNSITSTRGFNPIYASREMKILLYCTTNNFLSVNLYDTSQGSSESIFIVKGKKISNLNSNCNGTNITADNFNLKACNSCTNEIYSITLESLSIDNLNFYWYVSNIEKQ
ncbi:hypothetical protein V3471_14800, partial [Flavobacterium oreochromis]|uniref:hypothetical protein n=1 Tax=Flavobacterium oreochromis TaxID=2906078 RepID=UPI0038599145